MIDTLEKLPQIIRHKVWQVESSSLSLSRPYDSMSAGYECEL